MKAKSLHFAKSGSAQIIASELGRVHQCVCDQLPPAYPCENERVVFIGVEMTGKVPGPVDRFCRDLTPARVQNLALYVLNSKGDTSGVEELCRIVEANGVHAVAPKGVAVKGSLFKKGMPTEADVQDILAWSEKVIAEELK